MTELVLAWPRLAEAVSHLQAPHPGWLAAAVAMALGSMANYGRMQRSLLRSADVRLSLHQHIGMAYAAHSLNETLPGGPAFSTRFNYQQLRRYGVSPAIASWSIALSGIFSAAALAAISAGAAVAANSKPSWGTLSALCFTGLLLSYAIRQLTRYPHTVQPIIRSVLASVNRLLSRPADHGLDRLRDLVNQLRAARLTPGHAVSAAMFALLNWLLDALCLWLSFRAVGGGSVSATALILAYCAGMAAATITIVPGGLGIIDSALILGLVAGGVDTATAIAATVLYRLISFGFIVGAGWIVWLAMRRHR
nr:lysylphosphatidylglycerol synthase transmembrane domain-containing protein [Actinoplanes lutulentus]